MTESPTHLDMRGRIIVPLDVEAAFVDYLHNQGYDTSTSVPETPDHGAVRVNRTGGDISDGLDHPQLVFDVWGHADRPGEVFDLAQRLYADLVRASLENEPTQIGCTHIDPKPPVTIPDPYTPTLIRYQMSAQAVCHTGMLRLA